MLDSLGQKLAGCGKKGLISVSDSWRSSQSYSNLLSKIKLVCQGLFGNLTGTHSPLMIVVTLFPKVTPVLRVEYRHLIITLWWCLWTLQTVSVC